MASYILGKSSPADLGPQLLGHVQYPHHYLMSMSLINHALFIEDSIAGVWKDSR